MLRALKKDLSTFLHVWYARRMDYEVLGAGLAVVGALLWIRRDLRADLRHEIGEVRADLRALNGRIDAVLLTRSGEGGGGG